MWVKAVKVVSFFSHLLSVLEQHITSHEVNLKIIGQGLHEKTIYMTAIKVTPKFEMPSKAAKEIKDEQVIERSW